MATGDPDARRLPPPSFLQSLKAYCGTWVDLLQTRAELFSTELAEERDRIQHILILAAAAAFCLAFGILLITLFVVAAFWETNYRLAVLGGFGLLYLAVGAVVAVITRRKARHRPKLFSASLEELAKDYQHLSSRL